MVNPQTVIKSILLNLGAPAQNVVLLRAQGGWRDGGGALHILRRVLTFSS